MSYCAIALFILGGWLQSTHAQGSYDFACTAAPYFGNQTGYYGAASCYVPLSFNEFLYDTSDPSNCYSPASFAACLSECNQNPACVTILMTEPGGSNCGCDTWSGAGNAATNAATDPAFGNPIDWDTYVKATCAVPTIVNGIASASSLPCYWGNCNLAYSCQAGFALVGACNATCVEPSGANVPALLSPPTPAMCYPAPVFWGCTVAPEGGALASYYGASQCGALAASACSADGASNVTLIKQYSGVLAVACAAFCSLNDDCFLFECLENGTCNLYSWSGDFIATNNTADNYDLYAKATCNVPTIPNGQATPSSIPCYWGHCQVTYTCNNGYTLRGSSSANCVGPLSANSPAVLYPSTVPTCQTSGRRR